VTSQDFSLALEMTFESARVTGSAQECSKDIQSKGCRYTSVAFVLAAGDVCPPVRLEQNPGSRVIGVTVFREDECALDGNIV